MNIWDYLAKKEPNHQKKDEHLILLCVKLDYLNAAIVENQLYRTMLVVIAGIIKVEKLLRKKQN